MDKKVVFRSRWLPYLLLTPQLAITVIFFFLPAGEALYQSLYLQDAFGLGMQFVGVDNFTRLFSDPLYLSSFQITGFFAFGVALLGLASALLLAYFADRVLRMASIFKTLLIWPYAVAPAVAGVLWPFYLTEYITS